MPDEPKRVAHYPLDIPLPFERYEHRRLGARDIMVNRIMTDFMNPSRVKGRIYDESIAYRSDREFTLIRAEDDELGLDLQVLRRMLFTSHAHHPKFPDKPVVSYIWCPDHMSIHAVFGGQSITPPSFGDQILDLVQRYYFETDDSAVRLWIERVRPPRLTAGPSQSVSNPRNPRSRRRVVGEFNELVKQQRSRETKQWWVEHIEHLRSFRGQVSIQDEYPLYDGGSFLPTLRQPMYRESNGEHGSRSSWKGSHWALSSGRPSCLTQPSPTLERSPFMRFILQANRADSIVGSLRPCKKTRLALDLNTGRGMKGNSIWATASSGKTNGCTTHWDEQPRGRSVQRHRRATSEPPPGSFAIANLPSVGNNYALVKSLQVIFPRMKLSQLDRRSRRRSLSRTRVAEMFDWDLDLDEAKPATPESRGATKADRQNAKEQDNNNNNNPTPDAPVSSRRKPKIPRPCDNCGETSHTIRTCTAPCGHCGAPNPRNIRPRSPTLRFIGYSSGSGSSSEDDDSDNNNNNNNHARKPPTGRPPKGTRRHNNPHLAPSCPLPRASRCKCVPFPTFHASSRCAVSCSRACGGNGPPGSFGHRNAMTCRSRCCMCGIRGSHSGRECRLRACRCGGAHLGQDCRWLVDCPAEGCDRFLCGVHCGRCGGKGPFVGRRCAACRGEEVVGEGVGGEGKGGRRRGRRGKAKEDAESGEKMAGQTAVTEDGGGVKESCGVKEDSGYKSLFGP
ncbi:hypothetical protein QBC33DRAFT_558299 [Phialemonium atrogriseum]|uniref:Uncharacterized protein n=1 Tax=Phialemonium atrogriseum TaxID=1093897 RepID=A0AAJ0FHV5_9PEZI|nr:uncharacterized protein QBC33DRAFT_558299 [Phialemonium atrogriseum]KAK1768132.1 hypothetical protein QBC33DRAFT_558299 [Phialemonium atrogriseum]